MKAVQINGYSKNINTILSDIPKPGKEYRFIFVRSDGARIRRITKIVEKKKIKPAVDPRIFTLDQADEALRLVARGPLNGKVIIQL